LSISPAILSNSLKNEIKSGSKIKICFFQILAQYQKIGVQNYTVFRFRQTATDDLLPERVQEHLKGGFLALENSISPLNHIKTIS
jgi:hypothetical protein